MKQIHKEIAEIMKEQMRLSEEGYRGDVRLGMIHRLKEVVNSLSEKFEKEEKKKPYGNQFIIIDGKKMFYFNPKEFKKRCGVKG